MSAAERTLGKLAQSMSVHLLHDGWQTTILEARGKSNIAKKFGSLPHTASRLLDYLGKRGAPVRTTTPPWSQVQRDDSITRGPHQSSRGEQEFVAQEMLEFCQQGYWLVVPYSAVVGLPGLCISPLGVVPQRDRRPRLIVDYTFSQVNADTVPMAPREAMQFGRAMQRIVDTIVRADKRYGPVHLAKIEFADGFYRVQVQIRDIPKLGVALPVTPGCEPLVAFPLTLPMGWVESPPFFTVLTETVCDIANRRIRDPSYVSAPHRLESAAATLPALHAAPTARSRAWHGPEPIQPRRPVAEVDIYVDDFLLLAQTRAQQQRVLRTSLAAIDDVFRPLEPGDPPCRKEPSSVEKLLQGDACWSTQKRMLGWDLDTVAMTLNLPPHRLERMQEVLTWISPPNKRLVPTSQGGLNLFDYILVKNHSLCW